VSDLDVRDATAVRPGRREAGLTGLAYLGLGITGMLGFLVIRSRLFVPDDPASTLENLLAHEMLARWGIALEVGVVLTQVLAALGFYRLFRPVDPFLAGALALFGSFNAAAIMGSAAFLATALQVAVDPVGAAGAGTSQLMYVVSTNFWGVGSLFFGLWLLPMGLLVLRSGWAPRALGWILLVGGAGYVVSAFTGYLLPDAAALASVLVVPATVGEFWMIGWLLVTGWRRRQPSRPPATAAHGPFRPPRRSRDG
jgi:hypothetical protein